MILYTCGLGCYVLYVYYMYMSVICSYILYVCEMLCVCYVSSSSGLLYLYMSVLCCYMLYVSYMLYVCYMSSLGGSLGLGYILFMRICVITILDAKWWWDLGHSSVHGKRCGFWESGCRRLARKRSVRRGSGAPSTDDPEAWPRHLHRQIRAGA